MFLHSMNFSIGKDNEVLRDTIFKFAQKEIAPIADQIDKDNSFPNHLWKNGEKYILEGNGWFKAHQKLNEPLSNDQEYYDRYLREKYMADVFLDEALEFIDEAHAAEKPFFLYYPSPIPHVALQVPVEDLDAYPREWDPEPYLGGSYLPHPRPRAAYAAMITHLDREVGSLLDRLSDLGLSENTIVMFSSDNGTTWAGGVDHEFFDSTGELSGLKGSVLEGGLKVPFLVRWPGKIEAGSVSDFPSYFPDVMPTLLEIAQIKDERPHDGHSLIQAFNGKNFDRTKHLYWEHGDQQALRVGEWKLVRRRLGKKNVATKLFHLKSDPGEKNDLAKSEPQKLQQLLDLSRKSRFPSSIFPNPGLDAP